MKGNAAQSVKLLLIGGDYAALITYVCELKKNTIQTVKLL